MNHQPDERFVVYEGYECIDPILTVYAGICIAVRLLRDELRINILDGKPERFECFLHRSMSCVGFDLHLLPPHLESQPLLALELSSHDLSQLPESCSSPLVSSMSLKIALQLLKLKLPLCVFQSSPPDLDPHADLTTHEACHDLSELSQTC